MNTPPQPAAGVRRLMRQIRALMAAPGGAQERLDGFVSVIAQNFVAEVCSVYLVRASGQLELCATEGLDTLAVHQTRLAPGEGLVGRVAATAAPLNVKDASAHPAFSYHPETGEERVASFLGAPILRGGRTLGVVTVQNRAERVYDDEEVEALQTAAMILAEVVSDPAVAGAGLEGFEVRPSRPERLIGRRITDGVAIGAAVVKTPHAPPARLIAEHPEKEAERLEAGIAALRASVDALLEGRSSGLDGPPRDVLETYRMIAHDRGWMERLHEAVRSGLTAEAAVERVRNEHRARLMSARDQYLRERMHDLEDLANRLLRHLAGEEAAEGALPHDAIVFARTLGPAELLELDPDRLKGVVLEEGSPVSHAAIVARALGVPMIGRAEGALDRVENGDRVIVDGERGEVHLRPAPDVLDAYEQRIAISGQEEALYARIKDEPAVTLDGRRVMVFLNAGLTLDLPQLARTGADGIGLFRTEFQFMIAERMPRQAEQVALYRAALNAAQGKQTVFRTLDLGGDKILPYMETDREENPAMGWRAARMAIDRPGLMRYQLRALMTAAAGRDLAVMFPLITTVDEFIAARAMVERERARARRYGRPTPERLEVGAMLEAPALAFQLDALLDHADFISVGANDLLQFFFAADRCHPRLADRYDPLSPAALTLFKNIRDACARRGKRVTVCGEIAGRPLEAMALIALGYDRLSMPASGVGPVKRMVRALHAEEAAREILPLLDAPTASVRAQMLEIAERLHAHA